MKYFVATLLAIVVALFVVQPVWSEDPTGAQADLAALVKKIEAKLTSGPTTAEALAEELKEFDTLLKKYESDKSDDVAQILFMKAMLYLQVLEDPEAAATLVQQLKKDFPDTKQGQSADQLLESVNKMVASKKVQAALVKGAAFPDFQEKDLEGKPLSISQFKGKVVLVDFWATWCGPCIKELPNVLETYQAYHEKGFEIVGISLDKDKEKLTSFMEKENMTWPQYFDGLGWGNKLAGQYGVMAIPSTFLLDKEGKIVANGLRGAALKEAVGKLIE